MYVHTLRI